MSAPPTDAAPAHATLRAHHLAWGWVSLTVWLLFGLALEALHGFKVGWYLDVGAEPRRLMFQLAHAHGALLGGVQIAFAVTAEHLAWGPAQAARAGRRLTAAAVLLPGGFLLGGLWLRGGDPGWGVLPAPVGGLLLCWAVGATARAAWRRAQG